ncbi:MAG: tetratricopeptide repeat protein [Candidatus Omnitrophota bacterium]|nr:tetratricopeptide repeat protein [Candidatus Omnitrophota bacterium]
MKNILLRVAVTALFLTIGAGSGFSQEAPAAGAAPERKLNPTADFDGDIARMLRTDDEGQAMAAFEGALSKCKTYDDYEKFALDMKKAVADKPDLKRADIFYYAIARIRIDQLSFLSKQNDIESGRLYMNVNEAYRSEAIDYLGKATAGTKSKDLLLDINFLKFLILKETFQHQKIDAFLDEVAKEITSYSSDASKNKDVLARMEQKFKNKGLSDYAMKLKLIYVAKVSPEAAEEIFEDMKNGADRAFSQGNTKEAAMLYDQYMKSGRQYFKKEKWAGGVMEIAEKYFSATRYRDARGYYEFYRDNYPDSRVIDYCDYKIGLCYYNEKNFPQAISAFESFINRYKGGVWFDRAFEALCRLYFMSYTKESAITSLQRLIDNYYRKNIGDYARLLIAILHYNDHEYDIAIPILKKIPQDCVYFNDADTLLTDINDIKKEKKQPSYSYGTKDTYKVWEQYMPTSSELAPYEANGPAELLKIFKKDQDVKIIPDGVNESGIPEYKLKGGTKIKLVLDPLADLDRYMNYQQDQEDISRLPKKLDEAVEKDLISISWSCEGGKFSDENETKIKIWEAPSAPGSYKISAIVDDLGLVRKPDRGLRKDAAKELVVIVIVG